MEDSQVLDAESKSAPLQAPEAIIQTSESIAPQNETPNKNIYGGPSPVVGEQDHVSEITRNINRSDYNTSSAIDQSAEPVVATRSAAKGNVTPETYWKDHYGMDDTYKATDTEDYSWNKIAQERSQYTYNQEATQVLSDYAKSMSEIKEAASQAMDQYFAAAYSANQTADKMGWSGGQVTSNDAKTAFLKASTAAGMYDKFELQKYGVESQLAVARMYAEANMETLALDLYQDEVNLANQEADRTGYYISPEAKEIMKQQKVAQEIADKPNATEAEKKRAERILSAGNKYFDKLGFEKDPKTGQYIGVKTLGNLEYEETVRSNKENERLQDDANKIAQAGVDATYAQIRSNEGIAARQDQRTRELIEATNRNTAAQRYGSTEDDKGYNVDSYAKVNGKYQQMKNVETGWGRIPGRPDMPTGNVFEGTINGTRYAGYKDESGAFIATAIVNRKGNSVSYTPLQSSTR